jgi:glycosyltransferase involved in cell wall biosynthesis
LNNLVSVVVPAFNEEGNIEEFTRLFAEMVDRSDYDYELIFVDDGSTDGTFDRISAAAEKHAFVKYTRHPYNLGLTEALQSGFAAADGGIYVFYPADLQYLPEDIPTLVKPVIEGADVSTGWKQGKYKKRFVSSIYNYLSRKIFRLKVHDLNSVKAFRSDILADMFLRKDWHRYIVVMAADKGRRIAEVKIPLYERKWGESKFSFWRIPVGVLDMIAVKTQLTLLKKPLLYFGIAGIVMFALAFAVGLYAIYLRFFLEHGQRAYLYLVLLLAGTGMGLFILGFLAEALASLKEETASIRCKLDRLIESDKREH